ncbi:hypothetical protein GCM10009624_12970 [Gordonia sinesedis]
MNRGPAILDRFTVALVGLICLVIGAGAIAEHTGVQPVTRWLHRVDTGAIARFAQTDWWIPVLLGVAVLSLVWGWSLIATVIRPGKVDDVTLAGSGSDGSMTVSPKLIASAVAEQLGTQPMFSDVSAKATDDRGRTIIRLGVTTRPTFSYAEIAAVLGPVVQDIRAALPDSDVHVQALVELENPK